MYSIAIDGPAGAGKSTIAKSLANRLDILYLDTGAMYRAVALGAIRRGLDPRAIADVDGFLASIEIAVEYVGGVQKTVLDGEDVSIDIREHSISRAASDISALPAVRNYLVERQRVIAGSTSLVLDGRDIGTFVLPNATVKFYLTASVEVRAERRHKELLARGGAADFDTILADISERDRNDMAREFAPLRAADDAIIVDSSNLTIEEVLGVIMVGVEGAI